jgi:hypothetical protein
MNTDYDPQLFAKENRALVIMRSYTQYTDGRLDNLSMKWDKENNRDNKNTEYSFESNKNHSAYNSLIGMDNYFAHSILPGKYKLSSFYIRGTRLTNSSEFFFEGFGLKGGDIEFEIKPNEVVYLGDIVFKDRFPSGSLEAKDSFPGAIGFLKNKYPELASRLIKNIISIPLSVEIEYSRYRKFWGYGKNIPKDKG